MLDQSLKLFNVSISWKCRCVICEPTGVATNWNRYDSESSNNLSKSGLWKTNSIQWEHWCISFELCSHSFGPLLGDLNHLELHRLAWGKKGDDKKYAVSAPLHNSVTAYQSQQATWAVGLAAGTRTSQAQGQRCQPPGWSWRCLLSCNISCRNPPTTGSQGERTPVRPWAPANTRLKCWWLKCWWFRLEAERRSKLRKPSQITSSCQAISNIKWPKNQMMWSLNRLCIRKRQKTARCQNPFQNPDQLSKQSGTTSLFWLLNRKSKISESD